MPTAAQIDQACRKGQFCYIGTPSKRQQIAGATTSYHGDEALPGNVHVHVWRTGLWEEVSQKSVTITDEPAFKKKKEESMPPPENIVDATRTKVGAGRKSGKRAGGEHAGPPTRSSKKKGDATSSLKDLGEIVGNGKDAAPTEAGKKASKGKWKPKSSVSLAKQGELPGVKTSERIDKAIESLAERFEETKLAKAAADKDHKESDELLVALMRRKKRSFYSRSTWGSVAVPEPVVHAKFQREKKPKPKKRRNKSLLTL